MPESQDRFPIIVFYPYLGAEKGEEADE